MATVKQLETQMAEMKALILQLAGQVPATATATAETPATVKAQPVKAQAIAEVFPNKKVRENIFNRCAAWEYNGKSGRLYSADGVPFFSKESTNKSGKFAVLQTESGTIKLIEYYTSKDGVLGGKYAHEIPMEVLLRIAKQENEQEQGEK